ncbi:hypothetical protein [Streptomyces sp. NPDC050704]|uniref:hypothetical protein n=1 Tax=Streptomyces sp. NPDC050704 TaxID=3157219 RepID=UPI00342A8F48
MTSSRHAQSTGESTDESTDLPVADFDGLPLGEIEHRIRALDESELRDLLEHERGHAHRTPVLEILTARLHQLSTGAEPTGSGSAASPPRPAPPSGGSPVSPETSPEPMNPPPHGTPDQFGKPKGNRAR